MLHTNPLRPDTSSTDWQPKLGELGAVVTGVEDIEQCIRTILLTPRGSLPHDLQFGSGLWAYLDAPMAAVRPQIMREVLESLTRWEPRVQVNRVTADADERAGALLVVVDVTVRRSSAVARIEVEVSR